MSITSLGYHTFTLFMRLTMKEALELRRAFKNCFDVTVIPCTSYRLSPHADEFTRRLHSTIPRYYKIVYPGQEKGISWVLRLSSSSPSYINGSIDEDKPCSIKATINPKIFTGIKDYVTAANQFHLMNTIQNFNIEASRISPVLKTFDQYSLNRSDYCINFDLKELGIPCTVEQMMILIQRSYIPRHFIEWKNDEESYQKVHEKNSFYLKNGSMQINCYGKHFQLSDKFSDCPNIADSLNVVRFEVQCEYLKVFNMVKVIKNNNVYSNPMIVQELLSDDVSVTVVKKYYYKIIRKGDYYTLDGARQRIIELHHFSKNKENRLIDTLDLVSRCRGISKAKDTLQGERLDDFKRSLRDLDEININPVTIPREWNIKYIPNLMTAYYDKIADDQAKEYLKQKEAEMLDDYLEDCRKHKKKGIRKG